MGIKWMIKKSDYNEIRKSVNAADDKKLEALKKEVIAILKKHENAEVKKAIEYFEKDEERYSHLEKSLTGEWIEKAGYGVGTVRIWKGKKYKKVSASPTRWVRVFDKEDRGAKSSMTRLINKVNNCKSTEELYQFCMSNHSLFQDENGVDLPIMDKLRAAIDSQSGKIERGEALVNKVKKINSDAKGKVSYKETESNNDVNSPEFKKQFKESYLQALKDVKNLSDAKLRKDLKWWEDAVEQHKDSPALASYMGKVQAFSEELADRVNAKEKEGEKPVAQSYWMVDKNGRRINNNDAMQIMRNNWEEIDRLANSDEPRKEMKIRDLKNYNDDIMDKLIPDERSEMKAESTLHYNPDVKAPSEESEKNRQERIDQNKKDKDFESEAEKHQNRSDAMKGNKNAYKGGYSDDEISKMKEIREQVNAYFDKKGEKVRPGDSKYNDKLIDMGKRSKDKEVSDLCFALRKFDGKTPEEFQQNYEKRIVQGLHDNKDFTFEENIAGEIMQNSQYWAAHIDERPAHGLIELATLLNLAKENVTKVDDGYDKKGFGNAADVLKDMQKYSNHPEAFDDVIKGYEELDKKYNPNAGKEEPKTQVKETPKEISKETESESDNYNHGPFGNTPIAKAVEKYASDRQIKSTVDKVSSESFASTDPIRMFMNGVYHKDGYEIATDGRMLSMIKSDYPADDEDKIKATPKAIKEMDKTLKTLNKKLSDSESELKAVENKVGRGSYNYQIVSKRIEDLKEDIANAEKSKETGVINGRFPNYQKVIPSLGNTSDLEPASGFEDFNKILKVAKVAAAYNKEKKENSLVKVGDYNFDPNLLINAVAMAEKHGLKNVNFRPNSYNPAQSPIEFSGDNGYIVIMPMNNDSGRTTFDATNGDVSGKSNDDVKDFLSGDEESSENKEMYESNKAEYERQTKMVNDVPIDKLIKGVSDWDDDRIEKLWKLGQLEKDKLFSYTNMLYNPYFKKLEIDSYPALRNHAAMQRPDVKEAIKTEMEKRGLSTSIKKSLLNFIDFEIEPTEDTDDYSNYDASQPDLFNTPAYKVSAALDSVFGCR